MEVADSEGVPRHIQATPSTPAMHSPLAASSHLFQRRPVHPSHRKVLRQSSRDLLLVVPSDSVSSSTSAQVTSLVSNSMKKEQLNLPLRMSNKLT
ncbi:hypothetical protein PISMIDRAFT_682339 [Pisolithus microcarpus 441]|uniref:Uncharacterized protein n=1 Tax=Pisolithus microcarpus 441 TaxID=765257 RepID=A0A0C9YUI4_9AGAM|nr:hypothetical protein PISMIDRAFT_682339 [Pisolithus microcarpus 441]